MYDFNNPGPGSYEETGKISSGTQVCTNFHSTLIKNIGNTAPRHQWGGHPRFRTPGPGTYRPPSDFGYLDFKHRLRDNFNGSINTGFDTSMHESFNAKKQLQLNKFDSIHSTKQSARRNNSVIRNATEVGEPQSTRIFAKKTSVGGGPGHMSSRNHITQDSTHYSMNHSLEQTPRRNGAAVTPLTNNQVYSSEAQSPELGNSAREIRLTKTPQNKGLPV